MKRTRLVLMAVLMGFALTGCDAVTKEKTDRYVMPTELVDKQCKIYRMEGEDGNQTLNVVYCPGAQVTTSTHENKQNYDTTVIDEGKDYGY